MTFMGVVYQITTNNYRIPVADYFHVEVHNYYQECYDEQKYRHDNLCYRSIHNLDANATIHNIIMNYIIFLRPKNKILILSYGYLQARVTVTIGTDE